MVQTLALLTRNPDFQLEKPLRAAQDIRRGEQDLEGGAMANRLSQLKLGETEAEVGALQAFRNAGGMANQKATKELSGFPTMFMEVVKAHRELADDPVKRRKLEEVSLRIADAAKSVALLPEGSPERTNEWNRQLDGLLKDKIIDQGRYDEWRDSPSDLVIDQAMALGMTVSQVMEARTKSRGITYESMTPEQKLKVDEQAREEAEAGISDYDTLTPEELADRIETARQAIIDRMGLRDRTGGKRQDRLLSEDGSAVGAKADRLPALDTRGPGKLTTKRGGDGKSREAPIEFTVGNETAEFQALKKAGKPFWFINPATGKILYYKGG